MPSVTPSGARQIRDVNAARLQPSTYTVSDFFQLPNLPGRQVWKFEEKTGAGEYRFSEQRFTDEDRQRYHAMVDCFNTARRGGISADEANQIVELAKAGGTDSVRILALWRGVIGNSGGLNVDSNRILNEFLMSVGLASE